MSGHKKATISISQEEFNRLYEAEKKLRNLEKNQSRRSDVHQQETIQALLSELAQTQSRHQEFLQTIAQYDASLSAIEEQANLRIVHQQEEFIHNLEHMQAANSQETNRLIAEHTESFLQIIQEEKDKHETELSSLRSEIQSFRDERVNQNQTARSAIAMAQKYLHHIRQNYDHEKFAPGMIRKLEFLVSQAENHIQLGMPEASYLAAIDVCNQLSDLRLSLEESTQEWMLNYYHVSQMATELLESANQRQRVPGIDLEGNIQPEEIDVDYWSGNKLVPFLELVENIVVSLQNEWHQFSTEELVKLREQLIPELEESLEQVIFNARMAALNSQLRINIADIIVQALQSQGFGMVDSRYDRKDQRREYVARMRNYQGDEVDIQVVPLPGTNGENEWHLLSHDSEIRTEHELIQRARELNNALAGYGLDISPITVVKEEKVGYQVPIKKGLQQPSEPGTAYLRRTKTHGTPRKDS